MNPLYLEIGATVARWALSMLGGYLIAHHVITADQGDAVTKNVVEHVGLWLPALVALAWGILAKYRGRVRFLTALESPAGTSEQTVANVVSRGMGAPVTGDRS